MTITITENLEIIGTNDRKWASDSSAPLSTRVIVVHATAAPILLDELDRHILNVHPVPTGTFFPYKISGIDVNGTKLVAVGSADPNFCFGNGEMQLCGALSKAGTIGPYALFLSNTVGSPSFNLRLVTCVGKFQPVLPYPPIPYNAPYRPEIGCSIIRVPQGHFAIALGPVSDIGILYASTTNSIAVALTATLPGKKASKVIVGHFDNRDLITPMIQTMLRALGIKATQVFIAKSKCAQFMLDQVIDVLRKGAVPIAAVTSDSPLGLAIDLRSDLPIESSHLTGLPEYFPNAVRTAAYEAAVAAQHAPVLNGRPAPKPIDLAFNLQDGVVPKGYNRKASQPSAIVGPSALADLAPKTGLNLQ